MKTKIADSFKVEKAVKNGFVVSEGAEDKMFVEVTYKAGVTVLAFSKKDKRSGTREFWSHRVNNRLRNDGAIRNEIARLIPAALRNF